MKLRKLSEIKNLKNKTVLLRVDYNVAIKKGQVMELERIERSFPTINYLIKHKAKVILISHLGRPEGKRVKAYSLQPILQQLNRLSRQEVWFVDDCIGPKVKAKVAKLKAGQILLLENLRFYPGEENNEAKFARELASLADLYVNDAFAVCHRDHASVAAITKYLPAYAGLNLVEEVETLNLLLKGFKRPAVAVIGGVKISTKIKVIENFLHKYNYVLIGGALANNFLVANKINIGQSVWEKDYLKLAKDLIKKAKGKLIWPIDVRIAKKITPRVECQAVEVNKLNKLQNKNFQIVDIGPKTEIYYESLIKKSKTVVWNGPMGVFEISNFSHGTDYIGRSVALQAKGPAFGVIGGGETITVLEKLGNKKWPDFVSTAGGAMLEFLEGKILPGIKPLIKK